MLPQDLLKLLWEFNGTWEIAQLAWDYDVPWEIAIAIHGDPGDPPNPYELDGYESPPYY